MTLGLFILRVVAGLTMAGHGSQKIYGWFGGGGRRGTTEMMSGLGYRAPAAMATLAGLSELAGGVGAAIGPGAASIDAALGIDGALSGGWWGLAVALVAVVVSTATVGIGRHGQVPHHPAHG